MTETTFITVTELAKRDGVSKPAISKTVGRLVKDHDLEVTRNPRGHVTGVAVVQFDHLREKFTSSVKVLASQKEKPKQDTKPAADSLDEARRKAAWLGVEKQEFERALILGQFLSSAKEQQAIIQCGMEIQNIIAQLPLKIEEIAAGITKEGISGGRDVLRKIATGMCDQLADKLDVISEQAPQRDNELII